ncbi:MAG: hypothetical protein RIS25_1368 [Actinomycetota bacterium]
MSTVTPSHPAGRTQLLIIGAIAGIFAGFFGVGGGIIIVPLLTFVALYGQRQASATSLLAIVATALSGSISYLVTPGFDYSQIGFAGLIAVGSVTFAPLGSRAMRALPVATIRYAFAAVLVLTAVSLFFSLPSREAVLQWSVPVAVGLVALGCVMGFLAGLLGVGGGLIAVPALVLVFGVSDVLAKALSLMAMVPAAITGTLGNLRAGIVDVRDGLTIGVIAAVVSPLGVWGAHVISPEIANMLLAALVTFAAAQMVIRAAREKRVS